METKPFINVFIDFGMREFFYGNNTFSFERHIIECLVHIYGKKVLKTIYDAKDENGFTDTIFKFGVKPSVYDNFLRDTAKYEEFKLEKANNPALKTELTSAIEIEIITFYIQRCLSFTPTSEDISGFESELLSDFDTIKFHFNTSLDPNKAREFWDKKKKLLSDDIELVEIKPEYLDEFTYARFGVKLEDVKNMDYRMVDELNKYIKAKLKDNATESGGDKQKLGANTIITSGNGFVDALLIISIIATEISIGLIYYFLNV